MDMDMDNDGRTESKQYCNRDDSKAIHTFEDLYPCIACIQLPLTLML